MSSPIKPSRARRAGIALAVGLACAAAPAAAQAAPVNLGTAGPFVVLGGSTVTNTGSSVLNGDLGVSPGTALAGFGSATVNGATHDNDAVARKAQSDLTTAYNVAANDQPVPTDMSGIDLGNRVLRAGAYRFTSSAQLTGALTLDGAGDPNAQFVFEIASTLTTASNSAVVLVNGASPCNVYWQVGSSGTLGTNTAFQGNLMALTSISLNTAATVHGRMLARNGAVTLDSNVIDASMCGTSASSPSGSSGSGAATSPPASRNLVPTRNGSATLRRMPGSPDSPGSPARPGSPGSPRSACSAGFTASVRGRQIKRVIFRLDGKRIASRGNAPFRVTVLAAAGRHTIQARVTFKDATRAKTLKLAYRACAAAVLRPRRGPSQFTG
jgi:hypothetical protein